MNINSLKN